MFAFVAGAMALGSRLRVKGVVLFLTITRQLGRNRGRISGGRNSGIDRKVSGMCSAAACVSLGGTWRVLPGETWRTLLADGDVAPSGLTWRTLRLETKG